MCENKDSHETEVNGRDKNSLYTFFKLLKEVSACKNKKISSRLFKSIRRVVSSSSSSSILKLLYSLKSSVESILNFLNFFESRNSIFKVNIY